MSTSSSQSGSRIAPHQVWRVVSDAPLLGTSLAREAGVLLTWDEAHSICLYDQDGQRITETRAPAPVIAARISDDGARVALLVGGPRLIVLDDELQPTSDRPAISGASTLDIDPHGRYIVVASRQSDAQFYTVHGKTVGRFETKQPLTHIRFVPGLPLVVGASGYGIVVGVAIDATRAGANLRAEVAWEERLLSNLGRLEVTGDGSMILASGYNLGVQRYDVDGHNEGSYHVGGTAIHAVPDFPGRLIAVATQEGELALLNRAGNVRWKDGLSRAPISLEIDALGRYVIYGLDTGEICRLDIERSSGAAPARAARAASSAGSGKLREPDWSVDVARNDEEGQGAVLAILDEPPRVAVMTRSNRLAVYDAAGNLAHESREILGIGRILRTSPGCIAAATDRQLFLFNAHADTSQRVEVDLHELTHLVARPNTYGLAIVQEGDRVGRATTAGRWVWKKELRSRIEEIATGPMGLTAIACDDGSMQVVDAAGEPAGRFVPEPAEPLFLVDVAAGDGASGVTWITLARRSQVLRGHAPDGRVVWESPTPWEGWRLFSVGSSVAVVAPDGRTLSYDTSGYLRAQARAESAPFVVVVGPDGTTVRLIRRGTNLICEGLDGRVIWRAIAEGPVGPVSGSALGTAAIIGKSLNFFANNDLGRTASTFEID